MQPPWQYSREKSYVRSSVELARYTHLLDARMPSRRGHEEAACQLEYSKTRIVLVVARLTTIRNFTLFACISSHPWKWILSWKVPPFWSTLISYNQVTDYFCSPLWIAENHLLFTQAGIDWNFSWKRKKNGVANASRQRFNSRLSPTFGYA